MSLTATAPTAGKSRRGPKTVRDTVIERIDLLKEQEMVGKQAAQELAELRSRIDKDDAKLEIQEAPANGAALNGHHASTNGHAKPARAARETKSRKATPSFERIAGVLRGAGRPLTVKEIVTIGGIPEATVNACLHRTDKDRFKKEKVEGQRSNLISLA